MAPSVLLVNPPYQSRTEAIAQISVGPPLGLAYLAASLEVAGVPVDILDANALQLSEEETLRRVLDAEPDVVGLTAVTPTADLCARIAHGVKTLRPEATTVLGGVHASMVPDQTLARLPSIDLLVRGEGERTLPELVDALPDGAGKLSQVAGVSLRRGKRIMHGPRRPLVDPLDDLPFPALHLLPMERYRAPESDHFSTVIAVRGCPGRCIYCSCPWVFGGTLRTRSPRNVAEEIERDRREFGVKLISFLDDTFAVDRPWALELCHELVDRGLPDELRWKALTRADTVDKDVLAAMHEAGCDLIEFGIESGSQKLLNAMRKGITVEQIKNAFTLAHDEGIKTMGFLMLGLPGETRETLEETLQLVQEVDCDYLQVSFATPYPGTGLHAWAEKNDLLQTDDWERYVFLNETVMENPTAPPELLREYWQRINRAFYLRPGYVCRQTLAALNGDAQVRTMAWAGAKAARRLFGRE